MTQPFVIDDDDRYGRLRLIPWWEQSRLTVAKVMVVGAGAIGNEVLKNLALLGIGQILIVDCDTIEPSNLPRSALFRRADSGRSKAEVAAEALRELNPEVRVATISGNVITDVGLGWFREVDLVISCLDNREARLWVNRQCWKVNTPWIDGGIQELNGVVKVFIPPDSACYECAMTENDYRLINLRYGCPLLSREDLQAGKIPTAPTIASIIGGMQVQEALKLLHQLPVAAGHAHIYNGIANRMYTTAFQRRDDCLSHESYDDVIELPLSALHHTAWDLSNAVRGLVGDRGDWRLPLDRDLLVSLDCQTCQSNRPMMVAAATVSMQQAICRNCGETAKPHFVSQVDRSSSLASERLTALGVPKFDIVRVATPDRERYILLGNDRDLVWR